MAGRTPARHRPAHHSSSPGHTRSRQPPSRSRRLPRYPRRCRRPGQTRGHHDQRQRTSVTWPTGAFFTPGLTGIGPADAVAERPIASAPARPNAIARFLMLVIGYSKALRPHMRPGRVDNVRERWLFHYAAGSARSANIVTSEADRSAVPKVPPRATASRVRANTSATSGALSVNAARRRQHGEPFDRGACPRLAVGAGERLADESRRLLRARQIAAGAHQIAEHRARRLAFARKRAQHVEAHDVARAFPDRVDRRLAIEPRAAASPRRSRCRRGTPSPRR